MSTDQPLKRTVSVNHSQMHSQLDVHTTMDDSLNIGHFSGQSCLPLEREEHSNQQSKPDKILPSLGKGKSPKCVGRSSHVQKESRSLNDPPGTCVWCFLSCVRVNPNLTVPSSNEHAYVDKMKLIMCSSSCTFAIAWCAAGLHYCSSHLTALPLPSYSTAPPVLQHYPSHLTTLPLPSYNTTPHIL